MSSFRWFTLLLCFGVFAVPGAFSGCSDVSDAIDALELEIDPPDRRPIDRSRLGVNAFFLNQGNFGTTAQQFAEIRDTLGINFVRVLFAWTTDVQPSPAANPNYGFYDEVINSIPAGMDVLIILAHTPNWMVDPANWMNGDPRQTWIERWVRPTVQRYAGNGRIIGYEVWNEPDMLFFNSDSVLGLAEPNNYVTLLSDAFTVIRSEDPTKLVVMTATTSIQQDFSNTLDYNKALRDAGAENFTDIWNVHWYGKQYERLIQGGGVADFLNSLTKPIWITESGEQGANNQLSYVEEVWPFLRDNIPGIDRIYYYRFADVGVSATNFGLRTDDPAAPVSDLYISLRDG